MRREHYFWSLAHSQNTYSRARTETHIHLSARWRCLWREEDGQTLVEYGLLIGLLALVAVAAVTLFGRRMNNNLYGTSNNVLPFGT